MNIPVLRLPFINFDILDGFPFSCASQKIKVVRAPSQKFGSCLIMSTDKINSIQEYHAASGGEGIIGIGGRGKGSCDGSACGGGGDVSDRSTKRQRGHDDKTVIYPIILTTG